MSMQNIERLFKAITTLLESYFAMYSNFFNGTYRYVASDILSVYLKILLVKQYIKLPIH